ncbi:MAG: LamG domain-containing protein [Bacteroidetes bacterium]|nr:LamG domain-containing protein [Bacteroidota bacterium]
MKKQTNTSKICKKQIKISMHHLLVYILGLLVFNLLSFNTQAQTIELYSTPLFNDANLVAYYRLSNTTDSKGSYSLTNNNSIAFNAGKFGNAADYGATNSSKYLNIDSYYGFVSSSNFTFSTWIYLAANPIPNSADGAEILWLDNKKAAGNGGVLYEINYYNDGSTKRFYFWRHASGGWSGGNTSGELSTEVWHHVCATFDGTNFIGYIDGSPIGSWAASTSGGDETTRSGKTWIGSSLTPGSFFKGFIDDVAFFNRALTATEVSKLYNGYPTITLGSNATSAANQCAGTTKVAIQSFSLAVTNGDGNLTDVGFTTTGTYTSSEITKFQLWGSSTNSLSTATQLGTDLTTSLGTGSHTLASFTSPTLTISNTYYFWITTDIASSVTDGHNIAVDAITTTDLTTTSIKAGSTSASATQTLKASPTTATNGSTQTIYTTGSATLSGNSPSIGTGTWSVVSGPSTSSSQFGTTSVYNTIFTPNGGAGSYVLRWTINNSPCTSSYADATVTTLTLIPATVDWNNSNVQEITLSANRSFTFTNGKSGGLYTLLIKQNATGGWTVSWPANVGWIDAVEPTLTSAPNTIDIIKFVFDGTNYLENGKSLNIHF